MKNFFSIRNKMLLYIMLSTSVIYIGAILYVSIRLRSITMNDARELVNSNAKESANLIKVSIGSDFGAARVLASSVLGYKNIPKNLRRDFYDDILKNTLINTPNCISTWTSYELNTFDSSWVKPYGRARTEVYKKEKDFIVKRDSMDLTSHNMQSSYYKMKISKAETILEPYFYSYTNSKEDQILITSICVPILEKNNFIGLAGMDISLGRLNDIVSSITPFESGYAFLVSNEGRYIYHPERDIIGKKLSDVNTEEDLKFNISEKIRSGENFSLMLKDGMGNDIYVSFVGFKIGETATPWCMGTVTPVETIINKARRTFTNSIILGIIGLLMLSVIVWVIARNITKPLIETTETLKYLTMGDIDESKKIQAHSNDEIGIMSRSLNALIDGLNSTAAFAREIGKGNLQAGFTPLSEKDVLGKSIIEMKENLVHAKAEEEKRKAEEEKSKWATIGLARFGEILRENNNNLGEFSYNIISNLVKYVNANQGGLFIINDENKDDIYIEQTACYAYDRRKYTEKKFNLGEGLVGQCFLEAQTIHITEIPDSYISITSGLGSKNPNSLLIVPLKLNDEVFGVFELASFKDFEPHIIKFIEKIAESVASSISNVKINVRTAKLLEASKFQAEELAAQEEEMRQNMEELQATQEESTRRENEMTGILNVLNSSLIVCEYNMEGYIKVANDRFCDAFKQSKDQLIGKSYKEIFPLDATNTEQYSNLWIDLRHGKIVKTISNKIIDNVEVWLSETYAPIFDTEGDPYKVLCIATNITDSKEQEKRIKELLEESKQKNEILLKREQDMAKETSLLDALMNNIPDFIYFKDKESKFIRISKSHAHLFGYDDPKELIGKSDFDFFDRAHAEPAFNDEQDIIKTGKPIINLVEKETWEDGKVSWVTTTKMPLKDQEGKIFGTFGVSKSITELKQREIELNQQNSIFELITSNIPIIIYKIDNKGKFTEFKGAGLELMGIKESNVVGQPAISVYPEIEPTIKNGIKGKNFIKFASKGECPLIHFVIENTGVLGALIGFAFKPER